MASRRGGPSGPLVAGQFALALVLLVDAGLLLRTAAALDAADLGFRSSRTDPVVALRQQVDKRFCAPDVPGRTARLVLVGCDDVDFYTRICGEARDLHGGTCGVGLREILPVDIVDRAEVVHVGEKDRGADNVGEGAVSGFEQRADVVENAARLFGDAALDHLPRGGIERHLT